MDTGGSETIVSPSDAMVDSEGTDGEFVACVAVAVSAPSFVALDSAPTSSTGAVCLRSFSVKMAFPPILYVAAAAPVCVLGGLLLSDIVADIDTSRIDDECINDLEMQYRRSNCVDDKDRKESSRS